MWWKGNRREMILAWHSWCRERGGGTGVKIVQIMKDSWSPFANSSTFVGWQRALGVVPKSATPNTGLVWASGRSPKARPYLHIVFHQKLGRAQHVYEVRPYQLEGGFALEGRMRIVEADVQRIALRGGGIVVLLLALAGTGADGRGSRHRSGPPATRSVERRVSFQG